MVSLSATKMSYYEFFFFFQAEDGIRDYKVTGVQTCALPILFASGRAVTMNSCARARSSSIPENILMCGELEISSQIFMPHHRLLLDRFDSNAKLAIKRSEILDDSSGGIALANMGPGGLSQPGAQRVVREHGNDRSGERLRLSRVYQQAIDAILDHVWDASYSGGYHGHPVCHGF